jgi:galactose mutarotase-like enzyme
LHVTRLQAENDAIREERDRFRLKYGILRSDFAALQARSDEQQCENSDLKRQVARLSASQARTQTLLASESVYLYIYVGTNSPDQLVES